MQCGAVGLLRMSLMTLPSINGFGQDVDRQVTFRKWWEDYHHHLSWGCQPDSCTVQDCWWASARHRPCFWWQEYPTWQPWDENFSE